MQASIHTIHCHTAIGGKTVCRLTIWRLTATIWVYRTANLQMLHFIYLFKSIRTEYFKHAA